MRKFINSLSKEQKQGLVSLLKSEHGVALVIANALESQLEGNSQPLDLLIGSGTEQEKPAKKYGSDSVDPSVARYMKEKVAESISYNKSIKENGGPKGHNGPTFNGNF